MKLTIIAKIRETHTSCSSSPHAASVLWLLQNSESLPAHNGGGWLWPLPSHVAWRHPNHAHRHCPHTMGDAACAWFGLNPMGRRMVNNNHHQHDFTLWLIGAFFVDRQSHLSFYSPSSIRPPPSNVYYHCLPSSYPSPLVCLPLAVPILVFPIDTSCVPPLLGGELSLFPSYILISRQKKIFYGTQHKIQKGLRENKLRFVARPKFANVALSPSWGEADLYPASPNPMVYTIARCDSGMGKKARKWRSGWSRLARKADPAKK